MEINTLEQRIEKANEKLTKLEAKLERVKVALDGGKNPYYYNESDLRRTNREIEEVKASIEKYTIELNKEINKEKAPKIQVLVDFLAGWRQKAYDFYYAQAEAYGKAYDKHYSDMRNLEQRYYKDHNMSYEEYNSEYDRLLKEWKVEQKHFDPVGASLSAYKDPFVDVPALNKMLDREVKRKYEDLVNRITKVIGQINDCSALSIGGNGSINGIVKGTNGKAYLETITAGGYNIQCLHYRVIIHKIKE